MTTMTELEFRNFLSAQGHEIKLTHRIAVGQKGGPAPLIQDMDWNPRCRSLIGKDAVAVLAAMSSFGTHLYYLPRIGRKWTTLVIKNRPSRQGSSLRWHKSGKHLATTSDFSDTKQANVTILSFDINLGSFNVTSRILCTLGSKPSSLAWISQGQILLLALYPSTWIFFFEFNRKDGALTSLGKRKCQGFPRNSPVGLQSHPSAKYFFTCSEYSHTILVWGEQTSEDRVKWGILRTVQSGTGLYAMAYSMVHSGLIAIEKDRWKLFRFNIKEDQILELIFTSLDEHSIIKGQQHRWQSGLISMAASRDGRLLASGGYGDTFMVHTKVPRRLIWKPDGSRNSNVCYGQVKCVKFNPEKDNMMMVSTGANTGFIHIWAIYERTSDMYFVDPERTLEHVYYVGRLDQVNVPSTSLDEGHVDEDQGSDGEDELVVSQDHEVVVSQDHQVVVEQDHEVVVEYEEKVENQEEEQEVGEGRAEEQLQQGVEGEAEEQLQRGVEGKGRAVESGAMLRERFNAITQDAEEIMQRFGAEGVPPAELVISMCQKILDDKDAINNLLGKET